MSADWDHQLASLLNELSSAQGELLELLNEKIGLLLASDLPGLTALQSREENLVGRLQACQEQRESLLAQAAQEGLPNDSIRSLAQALPRSLREGLNLKIRETSARARLLQHQSLTNWVLVQRTLIHLSQVLEIIATGGRLTPTYGNGNVSLHCSGGSLVDQAA